MPPSACATPALCAQLDRLASSAASAGQDATPTPVLWWQVSALLSDLRSVPRSKQADAAIQRGQALLHRLSTASASPSPSAPAPAPGAIAGPSRVSALQLREALARQLDMSDDDERVPSDSESDITLPDQDTAPAPVPAPTPAPAPAPGAAMSVAASASASASGDTILQSDRATHDALSSELLRMAQVLKSNSLAFADALERDRLLVEKAGHDLASNLDLMTRTRGKLGIYSKKARSMGCFTLSALLLVLLSWVTMFFVIRLT